MPRHYYTDDQKSKMKLIAKPLSQEGKTVAEICAALDKAGHRKANGEPLTVPNTHSLLRGFRVKRNLERNPAGSTKSAARKMRSRPSTMGTEKSAGDKEALIHLVLGAKMDSATRVKVLMALVGD